MHRGSALALSWFKDQSDIQDIETGCTPDHHYGDVQTPVRYSGHRKIRMLVPYFLERFKDQSDIQDIETRAPSVIRLCCGSEHRPIFRT